MAKHKEPEELTLIQEDAELSRLGDWLPKKSNLKRNFRDFKLSACLSLIELAISAVFIGFLYRTVIVNNRSNLLFYGLSALKYLLEIFIVIVIVFKIEKRHLGSIGLRNFKKENLLFGREIFWTTFFGALAIIGIVLIFLLRPPKTLELGKLFLQGFYLLLCVALGEEVVWRGYFFSRFCRSTGKFVATFLLLLLMILWHLPYHLYVSSHSGIPIFSLILFNSVSGTFLMVFLVFLSAKLIGRWNIYFAVSLHWFLDFKAFLSS